MSKVTRNSHVVEEAKFVRGLGLMDSTMIVAGSMIGSGIFIVSADIARQLGSPGWLLLIWILTGVLTVIAALSYGELAAMMPHAGGQYVYLREAYSPFWAFLYGWAMFLVIQTGTIAAVAVAFARFLGVLWPQVGADNFIFNAGLVHLFGSDWSLSLSTQQLVAIFTIALLTLTNITGLKTGKLIQDIFTITKVAALLGLILLGFLLGRSQGTFSDPNFWTPVAADGSVLRGLALWMVVGTAMVGSLFSADAWNNITFTASEVKQPQRNIPLSLLFGTGLVTLLYILANVVYIYVLSMKAIQTAPEDRVGTAAAQVIFGANAAVIMAVLIMISTFGCNNGLILAGARIYYAMARDGLFFKRVGQLNDKRVPATALVLQGIWSALLTLPRTYSDGKYSNLYSDLLDYVVFGVMIFYVITMLGLFVLRKKRPEAERPYKTWGYPVVPAFYVLAAALISIDLLIAPKTQTNAWRGLMLVLTGVPIYFIWRTRRPSIKD